MGKTLVVLRVSTDEQDTESQKKELVSYLTGKGLNESDFIYLDAVGASAAQLNDKYIEFIDKIKDYCITGKVDSIALWHLNRLGRNDKILSEMLFFFIDNKIQVYVKEPSFNLLDDKKAPNIVSKMLWEMFAILIKSETDELKAKTKRGIEHKKSKGLYVGGTISYGYKIVDDKKVENIDESLFIKKVREYYSTGNYSTKTLYEEFKGETLRDKEITPYTIETLLGDSYKVFSTKSINDKIDKVKDNNNKVARKKHKDSYVALATKLIKCPSCGSLFTFGKDYYSCSRHSHAWRTPDIKCSFKGTIKAEPLDNLLWGLVIDIDSNKANIISREDIKKLTKDKLELEKKLQNTIKLKDKVIATKKRVLGNYEKGYIEEPERDAKMKVVDNELKDINDRVESINSNITIIVNKIKLLETGKAKIDYTTFNAEDKYKLIHTHIEKITIIEGANRYNKTINIYDKYDRLYIYEYNSREKKKPYKLTTTRVNTKALELDFINSISKGAYNNLKYPSNPLDILEGIKKVDDSKK